MNRLHEAGGFGSVQFVQQGGMPSAPSNTLSGYLDHRIPHALDRDEIGWLVREYAESAALAAAGNADALELHANHDDVLQWFLSPLTNRRSDGYGGSFDNRRRLLREVVEAMRGKVDRPITIGLRLCIDEMIDGGATVADARELVAAFTADGTVDYFSLDVGDNWGRVSYVQPGFYDEAQWAPLCGEVKQATDLPVVYVGRVTSVASAERVLAAGHADLVGFARATIADPELVAKALDGRADEVRPCVGLQECIDRRVVERLPFGCAVNPRAGRADDPPARPAGTPRSVLVVGGGPAGSEFAAQMAERGHRVQLWEREPELGGQLTVAARLRLNRAYADWVHWQQARLTRLGVDVRLDTAADVDQVLAASADVVAIATGARARRPEVPGVDLPHVSTATDVATGAVSLGRHVLVVSEDDRLAPLAVADHLAGTGCRVTLMYRSTAPSPLVGKYTIGAVLARLDEAAVSTIAMTRLVAVDSDRVTVANAYSGRRWTLDDVDSVVLACGAVPVDDLYHELKPRHPAVHLLGDAFAPRRVVFATLQAYELACTFD
jgi:2,4-dienoyl-CoA reductase-like NADH-dependent reductase (Old Yellow Enzyme family)/thioredoxin reductase